MKETEYQKLLAEAKKISIVNFKFKLATTGNSFV